MTLLQPYGLNSALNRTDSPFGQAAADCVTKARSGDAYRKLEKAFEAEREPHKKAADIGNLIMTKALAVGAGVNGNQALRLLAQRRGFPIESDRPYETRVAKAVSAALAKLRGTPGHPAMAGLINKAAMPAASPGDRVRALKKANDSGATSPYLTAVDRNAPVVFDRNLHGAQGATISTEALETLNSLPDGRQRNAALNALMVRPPLNPNDNYKWRQSIVEIIDYILRMCGDSGKPLIDSLAERIGEDGEISFYDPMVQSRPPSYPPRDSDISATSRDVDSWRSSLRPPTKEIDPGAFANSGGNSDYMSPDFKVAKHAILCKFADVSKRNGRTIEKNWQDDPDQLRQYCEVVVADEFPSGIKMQLIELMAARKRSSDDRWRKVVMGTPMFQAIVKAITGHPNLSWAQRGAALSLIT
jgi:hypothetical protein